MNNLEKIYAAYGDNICLFPFMAVFYSQSIPQSAFPCSVMTGTFWSFNNNLIDTINQPNWINIRKDFANGKSCHEIRHCRTCSLAEKSNSHSPRQLNNRYFSDLIETDIVEHVQEVIDRDYRADKILSLEFAPSNYCNFECVMCTGSASSTRNTFEIRVLGQENRRKIEFADDKSFYPLLDNVEIINFCGGETVLQKSVHELIDYLISQGLAEKISIGMLTNASKYPDSLIDKFKKFKKLFYTVSIDGINDVIEYQRRGCKWQETEQIALRLNQELDCVVNYVITAINVFSFVETVDWFAKYNIQDVILSLVADTNRNISVEVIPTDLKNDLIKKIKSNFGKYQKEYFNSLLEQMVDILERNSYDPKLLPQFESAIAIEDSASKKKLIDVVPEWRPYFD